MRKKHFVPRAHSSCATWASSSRSTTSGERPRSSGPNYRGNASGAVRWMEGRGSRHAPINFLAVHMGLQKIFLQASGTYSVCNLSVEGCDLREQVGLSPQEQTEAHASPPSPQAKQGWPRPEAEAEATQTSGRSILSTCFNYCVSDTESFSID